ncbi:ankyrin repeat domain-containing protein [Streptomyces triticagri]|uniref:Ankyrin repeat domain-containing protein n=1 Tax=Streptomyces triticagri TaxID=2293568 RepID=A0A372LZX5_9ACTN|nr:ankyrin repeat domain-containing protein [Streptomyces triticagri]RFU84218.1 ankyrin repeat domain-containing protein [Streptomyces triticagri]
MAPLRGTTRLVISLAGLAVLATACSTHSDSARSEGRATSATGEPAPPADRSGADKGDPAASRDLLEAARTGDADAVREAIERGADLETRDDRRRTPLLLAATGDHIEAAEALVAAGADPDARDRQQDTPWLVTGVTGSVRMARTLAKADPDYGLVNRYGGVSLIPAGERGHVDYIREVTTNPDMDVDVDHVNNLGWTALLEAVILGDGGKDHQESVRLLVDGGADTSIADGSGTTALEHAEERGYREIARTLRK